MQEYIIVHDDELYHHGIKGQKWGVRRFQNEDGTLTPKGQARYDKVKNTNSASYLYKNRKVLSEQDYDSAYKRIKRDSDLRDIKRREDAVKSMRRKSMVKKAVTVAAIGGVVYLTKTESGRALVKQGKSYVGKMLKDAAVDVVRTAGESTVNSGKKAVDAMAKASANAYKETRKSSGNKFKESVKAGNKAARTLNKYGKTVDKILRK